jgi:hypothetical protein
MRYMNPVRDWRLPVPVLDFYVGDDDYLDIVQGIREGKHFQWMGSGDCLSASALGTYIAKDKAEKPKKNVSDAVARKAAVLQELWEEQQRQKQIAREQLAEREWLEEEERRADNRIVATIEFRFQGECYSMPDVEAPPHIIDDFRRGAFNRALSFCFNNNLLPRPCHIAHVVYLFHCDERAASRALEHYVANGRGFRCNPDGSPFNG